MIGENVQLQLLGHATCQHAGGRAGGRSQFGFGVALVSKYLGFLSISIFFHPQNQIHICCRLCEGL